ncbi:hypothetical protein FH972_008223 [Carpinus fangiana]|uniref:Small ribosomal subunit protein uS15 N-terminal domain-containing protein n=1 Tax=Carpinus fangiana TaxID=176857 RepID=A0A5N6R135_9ROSI|nr:hypothetical protein FH972_008223 [Carpinus fangiana]
MGRMHSRGKGISASALPYKRTSPSWLKISSQDVEENICKFAKKGLTPSQIGVILRDSHGIAQVRSINGSKILRILKAHGLAPEIPEDLYHLIKKAVSIRKHLERNRKDKDSKFRLILVESRIHRLARYYKKTKKLPPVWKYVEGNCQWISRGEVGWLQLSQAMLEFPLPTRRLHLPLSFNPNFIRLGGTAALFIAWLTWQAAIRSIKAPGTLQKPRTPLLTHPCRLAWGTLSRRRQCRGAHARAARQVVWLSDVDRAKGYAVDFLSLSLHAISTDPEAYPSPCIYAQIEMEADEDESEGSDSESSDALDLSKITEMRLVPSNPSQLDTLFDIFCQCAELNPEPIDEEEEEHNWIFSADQIVDERVEEEDNFSQNPSNSIGDSNGDHDLARTVLEVRFYCLGSLDGISMKFIV